MSPVKFFENLQNRIKREWKLAFVSAVVIGMMIHLPVLLSDIPNHDGLDSLYFDQNMITSGRWFLMVACGFSSFYSLPWVIGLLGFLFLGMTAAALVEILEVKKSWAVILISGLLVSFPVLTSTFAYVFTLDGYMLALLLATLSVLFTKKYRYGFLPGALCLAFSMGVYQAYLSFAMILSIFALLDSFAGAGTVREKLSGVARFLLMGIVGTAGYYGILQLLLTIQGKQLASYQGIDGMTSGGSSGGIVTTVARMYRDFAAFTLKGNVLFRNGISALACGVLGLAAMGVLVALVLKRKWWKRVTFFAIIVAVAVLLPPVTNVILLVSPSVNYHLLMRYQWVLYFIGATAFVSRYTPET